MYRLTCQPCRAVQIRPEPIVCFDVPCFVSCGRGAGRLASLALAALLDQYAVGAQLCDLVRAVTE